MRLAGFILLWILPLFSEGSPLTRSQAYSSVKSQSFKTPSRFLNTVPQHAKPLVIIDPGHGGGDEGAKVGYLMEKRLTLTSALMVRKNLEEMGYRVILTRSKDVFIPLSRRVSIANQTKAHLFVSIHYNTSPSEEAQGVEVFYYGPPNLTRTKSSRFLGNAILYGITGHTKAVSRGVKRGNFHVIRETVMPSVLVEGGFMTHAKERSCLRDRLYLEKIARGIAQGIDSYFKASP
ncbi:hypothetical protein RSOCI_01060 [Rhabdochlamydiaceae symbiont of Dictyostelium giganteum]